MVLVVPKLEMHLAHACNLACDGCTHYSNYGMRGLVRYAEAAGWLRAWSEHVRPINFSFLGGEPTLNPEVPDYLHLGRELWPKARIRLVSNGLLLDRRESIWPALQETRAILVISIHSRRAAYQRRVQPMLQLARARCRELGIDLELRRSWDNWYRTYRGSGRDMLPFAAGDPRASWANCENKICFTLHQGALWKCPPLAYLPMVARLFQLERKSEWRPYLAYEPLRLGSSEREIAAFFSRKAESCCGMCPTRFDYFEKAVE